ncbi:MAG: hypothetical protein K0R39_230 [Symbiobacteriaceae bacterium]|jgi:uncharacterized protein (TIGR00106 family)|nr:hypothetical protein [Symbiobacteriaceae bacterium]
MALLEISVVPVGTESPSISSFISEACREAKRNGIKFDVTPTATVMEGDLPALLDVAQKMHQAGFHGGVQRVVTNIAIDERRDKDLVMEQTVSAVESSM